MKRPWGNGGHWPCFWCVGTKHSQCNSDATRAREALSTAATSLVAYYEINKKLRPPGIQAQHLTKGQTLRLPYSTLIEADLLREAGRLYCA